MEMTSTNTEGCFKVFPHNGKMFCIRRFENKNTVSASEVVEPVKALAMNLDNLSSIPGSCVKVEVEKQLYKVFL